MKISKKANGGWSERKALLPTAPEIFFKSPLATDYTDGHGCFLVVAINGYHRRL